MNRKLYEDSRSQLLSKSKKADNYSPNNQSKGKNRYERRLHSKVFVSKTWTVWSFFLKHKKIPIAPINTPMINIIINI